MKYAYFLPSTIGPWKLQETPGLTVMAFFNTLKYPTIAGLSANDAWPCTHYLGNFRLRLTADCGLNRLLLVFGRVPLFNCVLHNFLDSHLGSRYRNSVSSAHLLALERIYSTSSPSGLRSPIGIRLPDVAGGFANTLLPLQMVCGS
jgi:hypothetical protein